MKKIFATNSLFFVGWVEVTKPNSTGCCVGFRYRLTQPTVVYNWISFPFSETQQALQ